MSFAPADIDAELGGPWYTEREVRAMMAITDEHGQIVDRLWESHPHKPWYRRTGRRNGARYGTMA